MHETRDESGRLTGVEFYETERCYRATLEDDPSPTWLVTVDGHPLGIQIAADAKDTGARVRERVLSQVSPSGA